MLNRTLSAMPTKRLQQYSLLFAMNHMIAHSFCEVCTWHNLHILVTAPFCCDWKAQAASAQSFTLWLEATIDIRDPLICFFLGADVDTDISAIHVPIADTNNQYF